MNCIIRAPSRAPSLVRVSGRQFREGKKCNTEIYDDAVGGRSTDKGNKEIPRGGKGGKDRTLDECRAGKNTVTPVPTQT